MKTAFRAFASFAAASAAAFAAPAAADVQTGSFGDLTWEARSLIVGMTPTGNTVSPGIGGGGDPIFRAKMPKYNGVTALIMDFGTFTSGPNAGLAARFICSGSNLSGGFILTAAHCVNPRANTTNGTPITTAYFYGGDDDIRVPFNAEATAVVASQQWINPGYTGQVIDHNDVAILQLGSAAPEWARTYRISGLTDLTGTDFNVAGYGGRSTIGGAFGVNAGTGFLRQGDNKYDYRMGDPLFSAVPGNGWQTIFPANPNLAYSYLSDFDNGLAANDMACQIAQASNLAQAAGAVFCDTGRGAREVGVAGGDSGGPQFGRFMQLTSVTSYGLSFGPAWGDCRGGLQSSCGEFSGYVPLYIHRDWITGIAGTSAFVPEPATWAMMIAGFGLVGAAARRRRGLATANA